MNVIVRWAAAALITGLAAAAASNPASAALEPVARPVASPSPELAPQGYRVEGGVLLYRHGLRAPLEDEVGARDYALQPWPVWSTPPSLLTPHGREALRQLGLYDRSWLSHIGLLSPGVCPARTDVLVWTNTEARTIASGEELADGLADGCELPVNHDPPGQRDPLFDAEAADPGFDATTAVRTIAADTGGPAALIAPRRRAVRTLEVILGCRSAPQPCDIGKAASSLEVGEDHRGLKLDGPIQITSGTAEVFLLQYGEGMPLDRVGWGRATPERLAEVSGLHALLFDVFDRPDVMARRTAAVMAPTVRDLLGGGPRVALLVGHDNNIAALASLLGAHFQLPGYALDDPPLGGALGFLVLEDPRGDRFVRVFYQAQTLEQLRRLTPLTLADPPAVQVLTPRCATAAAMLCTMASFRKLLSWTGQPASKQLAGSPTR